MHIDVDFDVDRIWTSMKKHMDTDDDVYDDDSIEKHYFVRCRLGHLLLHEIRNPEKFFDDSYQQYVLVTVGLKISVAVISSFLIDNQIALDVGSSSTMLGACGDPRRICSCG